MVKIIRVFDEVKYKDKEEQAIKLTKYVLEMHGVKDTLKYLKDLVLNKTFLARGDSIDIIRKIISIKDLEKMEYVARVATTQILLENKDYLKYLNLISNLSDDIYKYDTIEKLYRLITNDQFLKREDSIDVIRMIASIEELMQVANVTSAAVNQTLLKKKNYIEYLKLIINFNCNNYPYDTERNFCELITNENFLKREDSLYIAKLISNMDKNVISSAVEVATNETTLEDKDYIEYLKIISNLNLQYKSRAVAKMVTNKAFLEREDKLDIINSLLTIDNYTQLEAITRVATDEDTLRDSNYLTFLKLLKEGKQHLRDNFEYDIESLARVARNPIFLNLDNKMEIFNKLLKTDEEFQKESAEDILKSEKVVNHKDFKYILNKVLSSYPYNNSYNSYALKEFVIHFVDIEPSKYLEGIDLIYNTDFSWPSMAKYIVYNRISTIFKILSSNADWFFKRDDAIEILKLFLSEKTFACDSGSYTFIRITQIYDYNKQLLEKYENASIKVRNPLDENLLNITNMFLSRYYIDKECIAANLVTNLKLYEHENWELILHKSFRLKGITAYQETLDKIDKEINRKILNKRRED